MRIARSMQLVGYVLYAMAGGLRLIIGADAAPWPWIAAYAVLGIAFHVGASVPADAQHRARRLAAIAIMTPAMLAMAIIRPCPFGALSLVVVASQVALVLRPLATVAWIAAQSTLIGICLITDLGAVFGAAELVALLGFQAFAVAAIESARREAETADALARSHADLAMTRTLLAEATRAQERTRIARDLHDVLGHNLTALGLQLEIASHVEPDAARPHTEKARELTSRLLADVRAVVAATRRDYHPELATAIRAILVDAPGLAIHLDAPDSLVLDDPRRADCVVRCVQEIVTNTRRHARGAANLWIRLRHDAGELVVEAHDDGAAAIAAGDGQGLRGMRSRLEEMGGGLEVRTAPDRAFALTARLPVGPALGVPS